MGINISISLAHDFERYLYNGFKIKNFSDLKYIYLLVCPKYNKNSWH